MCVCVCERERECVCVRESERGDDDNTVLCQNNDFSANCHFPKRAPDDTQTRNQINTRSPKNTMGANTKSPLLELRKN